MLTLPVLRTGSLIYRRLNDPEMVRQIGVIWRAGHVLSPAATAFLDLVRSADLSRELEEPLEEGGPPCNVT